MLNSRTATPLLLMCLLAFSSQAQPRCTETSSADFFALLNSQKVSNVLDEIGYGTSGYRPFGYALNATDTQPFAKIFEAGRTVYFSLARVGKFRAPMRARMFANTSLICDTGWIDPDPQWVHYYRGDAASDEQRTWRVEVYDTGLGGPTGDPPYAVGFEVWRAARWNDKRLARLEIPGIPRPLMPGELSRRQPPGCKVVEQPVRSRSSLELISDREWPNDRVEPMYRTFFRSGRYAYVRVDSLGRAAVVPLKIRLLVRGPGTNVALPLCESTFVPDPSNSRRYFSSSFDWPTDGAEPWAVEISQADQNGSAKAGRFRVQIYRHTDAENDALRSLQPKTDLWDEFFCFPNLFPSSPFIKPVSARFPLRSVLRVKVEDPEKRLSPDGYQKLVAEIIQAAIVWEHACEGCPPGTPALLRVDDHMYIDSNLASALRSHRFRLGEAKWGQLGPGQLPTLDEVMLPSFPRVGAGGPANRFSFESLVPDNSVRIALCNLSAADVSDGLKAVRTELMCDGAAKAKFQLVSPDVILRIIPGYTACGNSPIWVACETQDLVVEMNVREFTFVATDSNQRVVGSGLRAVRILPVMVHELGHWLGLPHLASPRNIMADKTGQARCIDNVVIDSLKASVQNGPTTANQILGLRYEQP